MSISFITKGNWKRTDRFLTYLRRGEMYRRIDGVARGGVSALAAATPTDSGITGASWSYNIRITLNTVTIEWTNSHINDGVPIAIIIQYGHGTGTGGYVAPNDYINPAMKPVFQKIADDVWKAVTSA